MNFLVLPHVLKNIWING